MIFPIVIILAVLILVKVLSSNISKLKYSNDIIQRVEAYGLQVDYELDIILPPDRYELHIYVKDVRDEIGKLAIARDEALYKKAKKGKISAKLSAITKENIKIDFFEK